MPPNRTQSPRKEKDQDHISVSPHLLSVHSRHCSNFMDRGSHVLLSLDNKKLLRAFHLRNFCESLLQAK